MTRATRIAAAPLIGLLLFYQRFISPMTAPTCRYYPSCSGYALTAIRRFGPVKGTWLAAKRLARCHPWAAGGVDHVPPKDPTSTDGPAAGPAAEAASQTRTPPAHAA